jgi:polysaccharide pyruvyl transferase WcaK-like protein
MNDSLQDSTDPDLVGVLDTAVGSQNYGDQIIMDAAQRVVDEVFPDCHQVSLPTHVRPGLRGLLDQRSVRCNIACGTNLLHAHMGVVQQWRLGPAGARLLSPVVLLGVGWRSHASRKTDPYTRLLLKAVLSSSYQHSVRDSYSEGRVRDAGIENVVNTGCPTMWSLTPEHCAEIPTARGRDVVLVLTDYSQSSQYDAELLSVLGSIYRTVYFWPQGRGDTAYLRSLPGSESVRVLARNLRAYDELLSSKDLSLDYVGTRLHGGIRALQHKRRSIIIGVDHRALVKGKDFDLPVIDRYQDADLIADKVSAEKDTRIRLPVERIEAWKAQFRS